MSCNLCGARESQELRVQRDFRILCQGSEVPFDIRTVLCPQCALIHTGSAGLVRGAGPRPRQAGGGPGGGSSQRRQPCGAPDPVPSRGGRRRRCLRDTYFAVDAICPHAGGDLGAGSLEDELLICPLHGYAYEIGSGHCPDEPSCSIRAYEVRVEDGVLQVRV